MPEPKSDVSLAILAGPADAPFLAAMVRHIVGMNRYAFSQRMLVVDTMPNRNTSNPNGAAELLVVAEGLQAENIIDRLVRLDEVRPQQSAWSRKHFGRPLPWARDYRGVPLFGWIAGIEAADCEYHVHFDSDILLHQAEGYSWIDRGIQLLQDDASLACVMPHPGPPRTDGTIFQGGGFTEDPRGFYRFSSFSSRRFLMSRRKYEALLPLTAQYASTRHWLKSLVTHSSPVQNWETLVSRRMEQLGFSRAALKDGRGWALHAPDHGAAFQERLAAILPDVERGAYPDAQAGHYDLRLNDWN